jgi:hypothetical protein
MNEASIGKTVLLSCVFMKDVAIQFPTPPDLNILAEEIGANDSMIISYFNGRKSVEQRLHEAEIIPLNEPDEVKTIKSRWVKLPSSTETLSRALEAVGPKDRAPILVVLGSSGSGKSTFAVKDAAGYLAEELHGSKLHTTMYLQPAKRGFFQEKENMKNDLANMFLWIRKELESYYGSFKGKLKMHVSLVLDELGATNAFFEDPVNVNEARNHLSMLAESAQLILAGTGVFATDLSSSAFVKCRMKNWESMNVTNVLTEKFGFSAKSATKVTEAIDLQPGLSSLLTNARAAFYVLTSLSKLSKSSQLFGDDLAKWLGIIKDGSPSLVASVVNSYSIMNV